MWFWRITLLFSWPLCSRAAASKLDIDKNGIMRIDGVVSRLLSGQKRRDHGKMTKIEIDPNPSHVAMLAWQCINGQCLYITLSMQRAIKQNGFAEDNSDRPEAVNIANTIFAQRVLGPQVYPLGMFYASRSHHQTGYDLLSGYRSYFRATVALHQNPNQAQEHQLQLHHL